MLKTTIELSVIVPAYNEEQRIAPTLASVDDYLAASGITYEIVVVDDGSRDGTVALVEEIARKRPAIRCIPTKPNRGKGHAVRVGMLGAVGAIRLMCDADGSIPAFEIPRVVNPIRMGEVDIAIGSRRADGAQVGRKQPWYRRAWSRVANQVVQRVLVRGVRDTQCGFKAFSAEAAVAIFSRCRIDGWAFDLEALALANRMGFAIREQAVSWEDDPRSRINPLKDAYRVFREMLTIRGNLRRGVYGELT
ncbi:MAG TPA: dolichyl-phosphate beta-glucosyltransferase [Kofleriaceae bacterium]|jgi:glycosyltransferase involved in cell wall biosynthesis|nr:dolichyl-phosphate beta-glucosyltransferase [Kofleriaceae bacterium]